MSTTKNPTRTQQATQEVTDVLKLIVNGPRFRGHLLGRLNNYGLSHKVAPRILKAALRSL